MNLSELNYKSELKVPGIDQADATKLIDTEIKLIDYKIRFIAAFGDAEIRLRDNEFPYDNELFILRCESFDSWKAGYLSRKNKAMQKESNLHPTFEQLVEILRPPTEKELKYLQNKCENCKYYSHTPNILGGIAECIKEIKYLNTFWANEACKLFELTKEDKLKPQIDLYHELFNN